MQKIGNISDWEHLKENEYISVPLTTARRASIICNSANPVALHYYPANKDGSPKKSAQATFLAKVDGREEIQFRTPVPIAIVCDGPVSVQTNQGMKLHSYKASTSFTKIVERRAATQDMDAVLYRARLNEIRRQKEQTAMLEEMAAMRKQIEQKGSSNVDSSNGNPPNAQPPAAPQPNVDGGASSETSTTGGEGNDPKTDE